MLNSIHLCLRERFVVCQTIHVQKIAYTISKKHTHFYKFSDLAEALAHRKWSR